MRQNYLPFGQPNFSDEEIYAVTRVLQSGWIGMGPETIAFEQELAKTLGAPFVVTVNSCTSALFLSLLVCGISPGDEVICPSLTWCSTANVALYLGATPIFCDVDPHTLCVTPELIQEKLTPKTKAVIVVHFGGLAVDVSLVRQIIPNHIVIIEDAAHALGAKFSDNQSVGASENLTCFSFYANKNLSTGEGGAIALPDGSIAERLRSLRQHGMPVDAWKRFSHPNTMLMSQLTELGYKMNYTDLQACIGRVQLKRQREFHTTRLNIAKYYYEQLHTFIPSIEFQNNILSTNHARHLFIIKIQNQKVSRDDLLLELRSRNIGASIHYTPLHLMPLYANKKQPPLINTEKISQQIMTLPISTKMTLEDAEYVTKQIKEIIQ
jgi:dTDP-4-amino-4,6-dideoxygalactose transaminase